MTSTQSTPDHAEAEQAPVLLDVTDGVAVVTLNRPDAMNSLDVATKEALLTVLERVAADPGARCVVLRGTGKAFCVGQDLKEHITLLQNGDERLWETVVRHYNPIVELIATMNKPVIAAINGVAAGAGDQRSGGRSGSRLRVRGRHPSDGAGRGREPRLQRDRPVL